jgi:hypothetical protein
MTERVLTSSRPAASVLRRFGFLLPVLVFVIVAVGLGIGLTRNPQEIPSALIGKPVPEFALPPVQGRSLGLSSADLKGEVSLSTSSPPGARRVVTSIPCSCNSRRRASSQSMA